MFRYVRVAVLASGTGTILEAILGASIDVALVLTDRPCNATVLAKNNGIVSTEITRAEFGRKFDRSIFTEQVVQALEEKKIDVIAMAGFGTVLGEAFFEAFDTRVLNTHPSLLPSFPGWHSVRDALQHGVKVTGCTVHIATLEVDAGPILAQQAIEILSDDDEFSLHERIKAVEREIYPNTIKRFIETLEKNS